MDVVLSRVRSQYVIVYMNETVIFSKKPKEHFDHKKSVPRLLKDAYATVKLKKCVSFTNEIDNIGHFTKLEKVKVANHIVEDICRLQIPTLVTGLRLCIGLCNVSKRFLLNITRIESPLSKRLCRSQDKKLGPLTEEEETALYTLIEKLISRPVLTILKSNEQYTLNTDGCGRLVGCVLLQK